MNVNPFRTGLILYKVVDEIQRKFGYSPYSCTEIKSNISSQLVKILEICKDPDEMIAILEQTDFDDNDAFWYFQQYDELFRILDVKIMDQFIKLKWNGRIQTNCSIFDYSLSYNILQDQHDFYTSQKMVNELLSFITFYDKSRLIHKYKYFVW